MTVLRLEGNDSAAEERRRSAVQEGPSICIMDGGTAFTGVERCLEFDLETRQE